MRLHGGAVSRSDGDEDDGCSCAGVTLPLPARPAAASSERVFSVVTGDGLPRDETDGTGEGKAPWSAGSLRCNVFPGLGERDPAARTVGRKLTVPSHRLRVLALLLLLRPAELLRIESGLMGIPPSWAPRKLSGAGTFGGGGSATGCSVRSSIGSRQIGQISHWMAHVVQNPCWLECGRARRSVPRERQISLRGAGVDERAVMSDAGWHRTKAPGAHRTVCRQGRSMHPCGRSQQIWQRTIVSSCTPGVSRRSCTRWASRGRMIRCSVDNVPTELSVWNMPRGLNLQVPGQRRSARERANLHRERRQEQEEQHGCLVAPAARTGTAGRQN